MEECEQRKDRANRCKCLIQSISEKINIHLKQFLFTRYVDIMSKERGGRHQRHQVQRRAEKKRARSFNELLEVDNFLEQDPAAVVDDGYG